MNDPLIRFLVRHCLAGALAGWTTVALLLVLDVASLGTLIFAGDDWLVPVIMLVVFFAITFGSVAMGAAVMSLGRSDRPRGKRRVVLVSGLWPMLAAPLRRARIRP